MVPRAGRVPGNFRSKAIAMTSLHHAPAHRTGLFIRVTERLAAMVRRIGTNLGNRDAVASLRYLDDRTLEDMGLKRSDLQAVPGLPLTDDPSTHLSMLVHTRRRREQR